MHSTAGESLPVRSRLPRERRYAGSSTRAAQAAFASTRGLVERTGLASARLAAFSHLSASTSDSACEVFDLAAPGAQAE